MKTTQIGTIEYDNTEIRVVQTQIGTTLYHTDDIFPLIGLRAGMSALSLRTMNSPEKKIITIKGEEYVMLTKKGVLDLTKSLIQKQRSNSEANLIVCFRMWFNMASSTTPRPMAKYVKKTRKVVKKSITKIVEIDEDEYMLNNTMV